MAFKRRPDGNLDIEGLFARKVARFPAGAYRLDGNTLELTSNGRATRHVAYPYDIVR